MAHGEERIRVKRLRQGYEPTERADTLAVEEPLEIRVNGETLAVTMRTPVQDFYLAAGFLLSEGVVSAGEEIQNIRYCQREKGPKGLGLLTQADLVADNIVDVTLAPGVEPPTVSQQRELVVSSSCGLCGRSSLDQVHQNGCFPPDSVASDFVLDADFVMSMPDLLDDGQRVFNKTGGIHAAGLYDVDAGEMLVIFEDVGRHNAVDKVLGWALTHQKLPGRRLVLVVSSRASFEIVQKAAMAGVPMLVTVSAPSSLAVELARESHMTLVAFARGHRANLYAGEHRVNMLCEH